MKTIRVSFSACLFYISHYQRQQAQMRKRKLRVLPRGTIPDVHGLSPRKEKKKDKRVVMNIYINSDIFCFTAKNGSLIFICKQRCE